MSRRVGNGSIENETEPNNTTVGLNKNEKMTMFLAALAIVVSVLSILASLYSCNVSIQSAYNLSDYQMKQQTSFDKQGAAEQFAIEISSIDPLIQSYAFYYFNNVDLTSKGKNIIVGLDADTYLLINSSNKTLTHTPFLLILNNNTVKEARIIATHMNIDKNGNVSVNIKLPDSENSIDDCVLSNPIIPSQLYSDNGMYYTYVRDIPKFNPRLAYDLDTFYYEISSAEAERRYIQEYIATQNETQGGYVLGNQYFVAYMNMRVNIMKASKLSHIVINELNEEISKNNNHI